MSQFTIQEMKEQIIAAIQAYYSDEIEKTRCLYVLTTIDESGCSHYQDETKDELFHLKQKRDESIRDVENMDDTNISSLHAKIFNTVAS